MNFTFKQSLVLPDFIVKNQERIEGSGLKAGEIRGERHQQRRSKVKELKVSGGKRCLKVKTEKGKYLVSCLLFPSAWKKF